MAKDIIHLPEVVFSRGRYEAAYYPFIDKIDVTARGAANKNHNVIAHERAHQHAAKGGIRDLYTAHSQRMADQMMDQIMSNDPEGYLSFAGLVDYPRASWGDEYYARLVGANAPPGSALPPEVIPQFKDMTDEQKLWYLKNRNGWQTDQDYLNQSGLQSLINRIKYGLRNIRE